MRSPQSRHQNQISHQHTNTHHHPALKQQAAKEQKHNQTNPTQLILPQQLQYIHTTSTANTQSSSCPDTKILHPSPSVPIATSVMPPTLLAPANTSSDTTKSVASTTTLLDDSVVTRTATWLDQANAILSSNETTTESLLSFLSQSKQQQQQPIRKEDTASSTFRRTTPASNAGIRTNDVISQIQEVQRLIHEGPYIMEQASSAGLSSKLLLGQSIQAPEVPDGLRASSTGALSDMSVPVRCNRGPNEQPITQSDFEHCGNVETGRPGSKRKATGEAAMSPVTPTHASVEVFATTTDKTTLASDSSEKTTVSGPIGNMLSNDNSGRREGNDVLGNTLEQGHLFKRATEALRSLQYQQELPPRRAFSTNQLSSMTSSHERSLASGEADKLSDTTTEDAAQALVGFLNSVRAESFRMSVLPPHSPSGNTSSNLSSPTGSQKPN